MSTMTMLEVPKAVSYRLLKITSTAFTSNGLIPAHYTCDGLNISPPLEVENLPAETRSLAVIVEDPDAPKGPFTHWIIWNIPPATHISEGTSKGTQGTNDFNHHRYNGPCPPSGLHKYNFKIYALDCTLDLPVSAAKRNLEQAIKDHVIGYGTLTGRYASRRR